MEEKLKIQQTEMMAQVQLEQIKVKNLNDEKLNMEH